MDKADVFTCWNTLAAARLFGRMHPLQAGNRVVFLESSDERRTARVGTIVRQSSAATDFWEVRVDGTIEPNSSIVGAPEQRGETVLMQRNRIRVSTGWSSERKHRAEAGTFFVLSEAP